MRERHLVQRGKVFYLRLPVNGKDTWRSLRTSDLETARRRAKVEEARLKASPPALSKADHWLKTALAEDAEWRMRRPARDVEDVDEEVEVLETLISDTREKIATERLTPQKLALLQAQIRYLEISKQRALGQWDGDGENERTNERTKDVDEPGHLLSSVFDSYLAERKLDSRGASEAGLAITRFISVCGDLAVSRVTKAHVRAYKVAEWTKDLSVTTIRKNLAGLGAVLSWAVKNGYCESNPVAGLLPAKSKRAEEDRRLPYTSDQLKLIFSRLPCPQNGYPASPPSRWWLPILGLYTGARLEELGQLHVADVREEDGIPYLDLVPGAGKKLKTKGSRRRVPLHPEIVRLGFLAYVAGLPRDGQGRVFPELKPDPHRALTGAYSKWYGRFLRKTAGITDRRFTFHSFRHTFKDACRAAGLSEEIHDALTGHSNGGSVGRRYGRGVPLKVLAEAIAKVRYPSIV